MKPWYKSKTLWFNALSGVVVVLSDSGVAPVIPPRLRPYVPLAIILCNLALRAITTGQPISFRPQTNNEEPGTKNS